MLYIAQTASWSTCWVMGTWSPHPFKSCDRNRIKTNLVTPSLVSTPQLDLFTFVNLGMFYKTQHIPHCTLLVDRLKTRGLRVSRVVTPLKERLTIWPTAPHTYQYIQIHVYCIQNTSTNENENTRALLSANNAVYICSVDVLTIFQLQCYGIVEQSTACNNVTM